MTDNNPSDDIHALFQPLPELDGRVFTQSVVARTQRIHVWRSAIRLLTYLCLAGVIAAVVPWQNMVADLGNLSDVVTMPSDPVWQISALTAWLQSTINVQGIQTPQFVMMAALSAIIAAVVSFAVTEA